MTLNGWDNHKLSALTFLEKEVISTEELKKKPAVRLYSIPAFDDGKQPEILEGRLIGSSKFRVPQDCVLLSRLNPRIPRVWRVRIESSEQSVCSTEFWPLQAREGLDADFLACYLASPAFLESPEIQPVGSTKSHQRIQLEGLGEISVLLPPLPEQRRIAAILSSVDEVIEKTEGVIEQLQIVKKAMMQELLTRGLPGRHTQFKKTEIGEIPEEWEVVGLKSLATIERGKFSHRPRNDPRFFGGSTPFIQTGDVAASGGRIKRYTQTLNDEGVKVSRVFPAGTIVITIAANIGDTGIAVWPVAFPDSLVGIQANERIDHQFLELVLRTRKQSLEQAAPQNAQKNINLEILKPLPIQVPTLNEQREIANVIAAVNERVRSEDAALEKARALKSALMSVLLTGELRVKPDEDAAT